MSNTKTMHTNKKKMKSQKNAKKKLSASSVLVFVANFVASGDECVLLKIKHRRK